MKLIVSSVASLLLIPILAIGGVGSAATAPTVAPGPSGDVSELQDAVLSSPNIALTGAARGDVEAGIVDPRVLQLLLTLSQRHHLGRVGPFKSGHSYFVSGTSRVSNHSYGRAVDISMIDGKAVSTTNGSAYDAARMILSVPSSIRPDEFGSPWRFAERGAFNDASHKGHLHCGFGVSP